MIARLLIEFWVLWRAKLGLPGAGWLIRRLRPFVPGLGTYPLQIIGVGTALLDFCDTAAFGMVKVFRLKDYGNDLALFRLLARVLKPGSVFWDVGANVGSISGYFAEPRFGISAIHAFEPNPRAQTTLLSLFANSPRVHVHCFGLGRNDETKAMRTSAADTLTGSLTRDSPGATKIEIQLRRGDSLNFQAPDLIKIDVEGFEPEVFAGLQQTIKAVRPVIIFEHIWLSDEQVLRLVPPRYLLCFLHDSGEIVSDVSQRRKGHDAILVPAEKNALLELAPKC
jgi:FkbM family methyltransferase